MVNWLVVSDVDHTLIERAEEAALAGSCLAGLHRQGVTTLLASSKTFAEMVELHQSAGLAQQPFLFENGCGVGWPLEMPLPPAAGLPQLRQGGYGALVLGNGGPSLAATLISLRKRSGLRFTLLSELPPPAIQRELGLSNAQAQLAVQRLASMPLLWHDSDAALEQLQEQLNHDGLCAVRGGRLVHVGPPLNKWLGLQRLQSWQQVAANTTRILACGDSDNDRALLENADLALVFHPPGQGGMALQPRPDGLPQQVRRATSGGPRLWLQAVEEALGAMAALPLQR